MSYSASLSDGLPVFSGFYAFGDSLVDPGNALKAAKLVADFPFTSLPGGAPTASKGYFEGRFTDGWNFADLLSNKLILQATAPTFPYGFTDPLFGLPIPFTSRPDGNNLSFAYGGAQAIQGDEPVPDLDGQTDIYRNWPGADPTALYMVTIGGNDIREMVPRSGDWLVGDAVGQRLAAIAAEIAEEVAQLYAFGARHVLVTGIPEVGLVPEYNGATDELLRRTAATSYAERLDALVQSALGQIALPAGAKLYGFGFSELTNDLLANPATYHFTNLTDARTTVQSGGLDPVGSGFLFFDGVHPSAQAHAIVAGEILDTLQGAASATEAPIADQTGPKLLAAIEAKGGVDDYTASLTAGQAYTFDLLGVSSGSGSLADPVLLILNRAGTVVAQDDDAGIGLNAHLVFVPTASDDYTIRVTAVGVVTGSYALQGPLLRGSNVTVQGGPFGDTIAAIGGSNYLRGNEGGDSITGGSGFDDINGNMGNDTAAGGLGDDWVVGGKDHDVLFGDAGGDVVWGNLGDDTLDGGDGSDQVRGGQGNDVVSGGAGGDFVSGDRGDDTVTGGAGADLFHGSQDAGLDRVLDFHLAEGDRVMLDPGTTYTLAQIGADTVIDMGGGHQMVLVGVQLSTLTPGWIFAA